MESARSISDLDSDQLTGPLDPNEPPGYERESSHGGSVSSRTRTKKMPDSCAALRERLVWALVHLVGHVVEVTVGGGVEPEGGFHTFQGILYAAHTRKTCFGVILLFPKPVCACCISTGGFRGVSGRKPLIIYSRDLLELRCLDMSIYDLHTDMPYDFATDSAMGASHVYGMTCPRDLQPWIAVQNAAEIPGWNPALDWSDSLSRSSSFDQFAAAPNYGYHSTYHDELYTTHLDRSSAFYHQYVAEAERLAHEIANTPTTNFHLADERGYGGFLGDEEDRFAAVGQSANMLHSRRNLPRRRPNKSTVRRRRSSRDDSGADGDVSISEGGEGHRERIQHFDLSAQLASSLDHKQQVWRQGLQTAHQASKAARAYSSETLNKPTGQQADSGQPEMFVFAENGDQVQGTVSSEVASSALSSVSDPLLWFYVRLREINEYALYLGMDPVYDSDLLWIAERALVAPLPENWTEHFDADGHVFFYCSLTDQSSWEHPLDSLHRSLYLRLRAERGSARNSTLPGDDFLGSQRKPAAPRSSQGTEILSSTLVPQDILEMAGYLNIDVNTEQSLFWIARSAVLAPLPDGWHEQLDESGVTVYVNSSGEVFSRHPADDHYLELIRKARSLAKSKDNPDSSCTWQVFADSEMNLYYYNFATGISTSQRPAMTGLESELLLRDENEILAAKQALPIDTDAKSPAPELPKSPAPMEATKVHVQSDHPPATPAKRKKKKKETHGAPSEPLLGTAVESTGGLEMEVNAKMEKAAVQMPIAKEVAAVAKRELNALDYLPLGSALVLSIAAVIQQGRLVICLALFAVFLSAMKR